MKRWDNTHMLNLRYMKTDEFNTKKYYLTTKMKLCLKIASKLD